MRGHRVLSLVLPLVSLAACQGLNAVAPASDNAPADQQQIDITEPDDSSADPGPDSEPHPQTAPDPDPGPTLNSCFPEAISAVGTPSVGPNYDQFTPTVASHCNGTNHQTIQNVQRVVFLGDSVTVGTPPTDTNDVYRNILATELVLEFGLDAPDWLWETVNPIDGTTIVAESGDFASCAKWGARAEDLQLEDTQLADCFPTSERHKRTLVIMTMGGNDLKHLADGFIEGETEAKLWNDTHEFMGHMRDAVEWLVEPGRFPNGVDVIFTNLYEYTDATGDTGACPAAALAGMGDGVSNPSLEEMVVWSMEEFMSIAHDTDTDMLFLLENFCGHGYAKDDPTGRCYKGPDAELWFDLICIHPNPRGHEVIAEMFMSVVRE